MTRVEFLWFDGCPNHVAARALLDEVLSARGVRADVESIEVPDDETAAAVRFPGSPTIRIGGIDIEPGFEDVGEYVPRCRVYATPSGLSGVPPREWIDRAIASASKRDPSTTDVNDA